MSEANNVHSTAEPDTAKPADLKKVQDPLTYCQECALQSHET